MAQKNVEKNDNDDWCIIADLELATVAPGSFIPQFPARKKKTLKSMTDYTTIFTVLSTSWPHVHDRYRVPHTELQSN